MSRDAAYKKIALPAAADYVVPVHPEIGCGFSKRLAKLGSQILQGHQTHLQQKPDNHLERKEKKRLLTATLI